MGLWQSIVGRKKNRIVYQCVYNGKVYDTEEEALEKCFGPVQAFETKVGRFPENGFFGTVVWWDEKDLKRKEKA
ncbi:MAG: hypothetical protein ACOX80_08780 [Methanomassiliicoccaceae archaeon]|jgi:hypothetical protein|nr:hypothetical protein [Euryarchaeota archaeon]HOB38156.1 hypothetical protein [Methanomassiliicoccaceae archaeon]HOL08163.1 hypothetical protein [Methanomassiliicoccaceae archaeon]HQA21654.1 hypothetical protein [Methanomassiliicoccaceae archaeon]HQD87970.1 hypothetical protein [Methanomassiliicoccaceae archaeon]